MKEVHGDDDFAVVLEERKPLSARVPPATNPRKIPGYAPFRHDETEFLEFPVDLRSSPVHVLFRQPPDQSTDFRGDPRPTAARAGSPTPVEAETSAVPAGHGVGHDDDENVLPAGPVAAEGGPEQPVQTVQSWSRSLAFEHGDLLSEG